MWASCGALILGITGLSITVQADLTVYHQSADQLIRVCGEKERRGQVEVRMSVENVTWYPVCYNLAALLLDSKQKMAFWLCQLQLGLNVSWAELEVGDSLPSDTQFAKADCHNQINCTFSLEPVCLDRRRLIVYCPAPESPDFSLRLTGGVGGRNGTLEMLVNDQWGAFCSVLIDDRDAEVACRQLGFKNSAVKVIKYHTFRTQRVTITPHRIYKCIGNESRLVECPHTPPALHVSCTFLAVVECGLRNDFSPRLADRSIIGLSTAGRLEVYLRRNWTPVCDVGTPDDKVARVACREMGLPSVMPWTMLFPWDNITDRENVRFECRGTEKSLSECTPVVSQVCDRPVGITCSLFRDYRVRLVGGDGKVGRLELRIGGIWGTVCSQGFSDPEARVVCRGRGFSLSSVLKTVWPNKGFGQADTKTIVWPYKFKCGGNEKSLVSCTREIVTSGSCAHDKDVAVSCKSFDETLPMRLVGGSSLNSGRLEVSVNGQWGTVCVKDSPSGAAKVACRQMRLPSTQAAVLSTDIQPLSTEPIFLDGVACTGNERHILSCPHNKIGVTSCSHDQDLVIECKGGVEKLSTERPQGCRDADINCKVTLTDRAPYTGSGMKVTIAVVTIVLLGSIGGLTAICIWAYRRRRMPARRGGGSAGLGSTPVRTSGNLNGVYYTNNSFGFQCDSSAPPMEWPQKPSYP